MDVWPALPLIVGGNVFSISGTDNIIAVLWQSNRVCHVDLWDLAGWQLIARSLSLDCDARAIPGADTSMGHVPVIPTPATLQLLDIPFPRLPKLLLSATHLVQLWLTNVPHSRYISPEAMIIVALISVLSSLESLYL
jgi:hypothetical protein